MQLDAMQQARRYDVDWLRNLALILLILYHVGMYYVADWGWHIKSDSQSVLLQNFMVMSNLWRMCLLFFISGMTLALIDKKYSAGALLNTRFKRLFIPLLFGMVVIVPPQLYYELLANNQFSGSYWSFWLEYINIDTSVAPERHSPIGLYTWNHLWYLVYLFVYTGIFLIFRPLLRYLVRSTFFTRAKGYYILLFFVIWLLIAWVYVRPEFRTTHALFDDWWSHAKYFSVMLMGYAFVQRMDIWNWVIKNRRTLLVSGLCTYGLVALDRNGAFPFMGEAFRNYILVQFMYGGVIILNLWCWMLALVGYAGQYLNKPSNLLSYANQAVLPWYILHQTLIVVFAANISVFNMHAGLEALLLVLLTILSCLLAFAVIEKFAGLRLLFGLKSTSTRDNKTREHAYI